MEIGIIKFKFSYSLGFFLEESWYFMVEDIKLKFVKTYPPISVYHKNMKDTQLMFYCNCSGKIYSKDINIHFTEHLQYI